MSNFDPVAQHALLADIGLIIVEEAMTIFENCGAASDFCIQAVGARSAVFGGTNRLLWSITAGFRPDYPYCTERFIAAYREQYGARADTDVPEG